MWTKSFRAPGKLTPSEALSLSSASVFLSPGQRVGEHTTGEREELLLVLEGEATLLVGGESTTIPSGHAAYVPPHTPHDVANAGLAVLAYVYVTAKAGKR